MLETSIKFLKISELPPQIMEFLKLKSVQRNPICLIPMVHKIILPYRCVMTPEHTELGNSGGKKHKKQNKNIDIRTHTENSN